MEMEETVISVKNLTKAYRIGLLEQKSDTLGGVIMSWLKSPLKNYRKLKNLSKIDVDGKDKDIHWVLKGISFEVKKGEVLGIIGRNGAGKSTLLKILSRITEPTQGEIEIQGRIASLLEVGTGFNPDLTGRENVYLNGTILGMTKKEVDAKFDEIVAFSGIKKFIDTPVKRYSSGMKVRLGFAVAAFLDPDILILDEVLAVGDAEFQKKCLGKMQDVREKQGRTVLFVSHNLTAVQSLCTKAIWLHEGSVAAAGNVSEVINEYLRQYSSSKLRQEWSIEEAPGNEAAKLLKAVVHTKEERENFYSGEPIELEFEYMNFGNNKNARYDVIFHLYDEMSNLVFVGNSLYEDLEQQVSGIINFKTAIPENLLHEGTYTIGRLSLTRNRGRNVFAIHDVLAFEVINPKQDMGSMLQKEGVVKPKLNWKVKIEDSATLKEVSSQV